MKLFTILAVVAGLALFGYLLAHFGVAEVFAGVAAAGWGVLWVTLYRFVTMAAHGAGWRALFPAGAAPTFVQWFRARWAGEAINSLLPVAQVGGEVARAQMVARHTSGGAVAGATVVVDFTLGLVTQLFYTALGLALLVMATGGGSFTRSFITGLVVATVALGALFLAQKSNVLGRISERFARGPSGAWGALAGNVAELNREVVDIYSDRARVGACFAWRMAGWLLMTGETWLILWFLGHATNWTNALVIESLTLAVRSAAFALPGALGVLEAGFVLLGPMCGVSAETALTLALVKRVRELLVGVPGIGVWMRSEGRGLGGWFRKKD